MSGYWIPVRIFVRDIDEESAKRRLKADLKEFGFEVELYKTIDADEGRAYIG